MIIGNDLIMYMNVDGKNTPFCRARNCTLSFSRDMIESTTRGSGAARTYEYGFYTYSLKMQGIATLEDKANFQTIQQLLISGAKMNFAFGNANNVDIYYQGRVLVNAIDLDTSYDEIATYDSSFQGDGPLQVLSQTIVKNIDYTGTGIQNTVIDPMLQPWTETIVFTYDGTNSTQTLDFIPNSQGSAVLNTLPINGDVDYKFVGNKIVIDPKLLTQNITYTLFLLYFK